MYIVNSGFVRDFKNKHKAPLSTVFQSWWPPCYKLRFKTFKINQQSKTRGNSTLWNQCSSVLGSILKAHNSASSSTVIHGWLRLVNGTESSELFILILLTWLLLVRGALGLWIHLHGRLSQLMWLWSNSIDFISEGIQFGGSSHLQQDWVGMDFLQQVKEAWAVIVFCCCCFYYFLTQQKRQKKYIPRYHISECCSILSTHTAHTVLFSPRSFSEISLPLSFIEKN